MDAIKKYWHWILAGGIFFCEAAVLLVLREQIYVGICDNLDLFITQLKMLRDQQAFLHMGRQCRFCRELTGIISHQSFLYIIYCIFAARYLCIYCWNIVENASGNGI